MHQIIRHPAVLIFTIIVAVCIFISLDKSAHKAINSSTYMQTLEKERDEIATQVAQLQERYSQAQSPFIQEKIVRDELLLQKADELVVQLPASPEKIEKKTEELPMLTPWQAWVKTVLK